jgi:hypothetical protein
VREIQLAAKRPKPKPPDRSKTRLPLACDAVLAAAETAEPARTAASVPAAKAGKQRLADADAGDAADGSN